MRILVVNLMHIGDLLLVTPVLAFLRQKLPSAHLALVTASDLARLVAGCPWLDELILLDKRGRHANWLEFWRLIRSIRQRHYHLCINLHGNERATVLSVLSGAGKVIGYSSPGLGVFFSRCYPNLKRCMHQVHSHFSVVCDWFGWDRSETAGWPSRIFIRRGNRREADGRGPVVAINPGGSWPTKRWPAENFAAVAEWLLERGMSVVWLGSQADRELVADITSRIADRRSAMTILTGRLDLGQLAEVLAGCDLMMTTDSGPMHVAAAVGTPVVGLFGPSPVLGFYPYGPVEAGAGPGVPATAEHVILAGRCDCHPCYQHHCRRGDMYCWQTLGWQEVAAVVAVKLAEIWRERNGTVSQ
ncbi:MAG: glycosyltransferase family 9 protein [Negativicutes bacterium]|nr:glycosyltransferase family 9 protein [Negativicutes bacterium]